MIGDGQSADVEGRFPHWVDTSAAQGTADLLEKWCREHCKPDTWICQHFPERRRQSRVGTGYVRFYFADESDAVAFRRQVASIGKIRGFLGWFMR